MVFQWSKGIVSPSKKHGGTFTNTFHGRNCIQILKFSEIMNRYTLEDIALTSRQNYGNIFTLKVNILNKKFQRLCHVQLDPDISFLKVTAQIGDRLH